MFSAKTANINGWLIIMIIPKYTISENIFTNIFVVINKIYGIVKKDDLTQSVAKMLQRKIGRNTLLISQDVIRREMLWVNYDIPFEETLRRMKPEI